MVFKMIVPALLTDKKETLQEMVKTCAEFTDYVQIDIMDGEFVPSKSIVLSDLAGWKAKVRCEAHLMVQDPLAWLTPFKAFGAERIIYHYEINRDHSRIITAIRSSGLEVGLAVNPATRINEFKGLAELVDTILFLSVNPGFYGSEFIPQVLDKIREFKRKRPLISVGIDGGVKLDNLLAVKQSGVDYVCVGSAILKSEDPAQEYQKFSELLNG